MVKLIDILIYCKSELGSCKISVSHMHDSLPDKLWFLVLSLSNSDLNYISCQNFWQQTAGTDTKLQECMLTYAFLVIPHTSTACKLQSTQIRRHQLPNGPQQPSTGRHWNRLPVENISRNLLGRGTLTLISKNGGFATAEEPLAWKN